MEDVNKVLSDILKRMCCIESLVNPTGTNSPAWFTIGNLNVKPDMFLGTINDASLVFKTNNIQRGIITNDGLFGIGNIVPTTNLDVDGQIRLRGGIPGIGKVLTSDANGLATWENASGGTPTANNGLSIDGTDIILGQATGDLTNPAIYLTNKEIPTAGYNTYWTGGGRQSIGYADTSIAPLLTVDVKGTMGVTVNNASYPLTLNSGVGGTMHVSHQGGTWGLVVTRSNGANAVYGAAQTFFRTPAGDANTRAALAAAQPIGSIIFQSPAPDGTTISNSGVIKHIVASSTGGVVRGYFALITSNSTGFITTEKLVLSAEGNVTIADGITTLGESDRSKLRVYNLLSGTEDYSSVHITPLWNTTGTPTAFKLNVTDSASDAASLLVDIQLGGLTRFKITKTITDIAGQIAIRGGSPGTGKLLQSDAAGLAVWQEVFKGGQSPFTADGIITVFNITHNLGVVPSYFSLTTTEPIANNHLQRTITFPDANTMRITFNIAPAPGENANYVWVVYK